MENLTLVNDSCERALALATKFNSSITKDDESYWELVLVVEDHCRKSMLEKKSDLNNLYRILFSDFEQQIVYANICTLEA